MRTDRKKERTGGRTEREVGSPKTVRRRLIMLSSTSVCLPIRGWTDGISWRGKIKMTALNILSIRRFSLFEIQPLSF